MQGNRAALLLIGSEGNVGKRLKTRLPGVVSVDRRPGADLIVDLNTVDYAAPGTMQLLGTAWAVVQLATTPDPDAPLNEHLQAVENTARLMRACAQAGVPRLVLASSDWAEPKNGLLVNAYGYSKRALEALAAMYSLQPDLQATALRIGWVPHDPAHALSAPAWLLENHWDDERLLFEVQRALGLFPATDGAALTELI